MQRHSTADIRQPEAEIRHPGFGIPRWAFRIPHSAFCIAALAAFAARAATVYVATANAPVSPTAPYDSWETAATNINQAVAYALGDGAGVVTEIVLTNGTHRTQATMTINRALTVRGLGGREVTIVDCGGKMCQFRLNHASAVLTGLAIQNVDNTKNNGGSMYDGGGVQINANGGQVVDCIIRNNKHSYGGSGSGIYMASANALVSRCVITNNLRASTTRGGGIFATNGRIENCLIIGNTANYGTALSTAAPVKVVNCTLDGTLSKDRTESAYGTFVNCVFLQVPTPSASFFATNCAFTAEVSGTVNSTVLARQNMGFADTALRLSDSSPLVNSGTAYAGIGDLDLGGSPRIVGTAPDIGCWENQNATFTVDFHADVTSLLPGEAATFSANLQNPPAGVEPSFLWTFSAPGAATFTTNVAAPSVVFPEGGIYTVALEVSAGGETATASHPNYIFAYGDSIKVALPSPDADPIPPYATWAHAATNIHDAVALQRNGATIVLAPGIHAATKTISLTTGTTISGLGGRDAVAVDAQQIAPGFTLSHAQAIVEGLTISNAANKVSNTDGIGVRIAGAGGTLRDCRVCHNHNKQGGKGMGVWLDSNGGRVERCVIDHNVDDSTGYGAGVFAAAGVVENCLIAYNTGRYNGGVMLASGSPGGGRGSTALSTALLRNCTIVNNVSTTGNTCWSGGIVAHGGAIVNCIVAGNRQTVSQTPEDGYPDWNGYRSDGSDSDPMKASMTNCAFATGILAAGLSPVSAAIGEMLSFGGDDICLPMRHSPCRNAGWLYGPEMRAATDLLGGRRVSGRAPDIGCHEIQETKCILSVR